MKLFRSFRRLAIAALALVATSSMASAQSLSQAGFDAYLQYVGAKARNEGVSEATVSPARTMPLVGSR